MEVLCTDWFTNESLTLCVDLFVIFIVVYYSLYLRMNHILSYL